MKLEKVLLLHLFLERDKYYILPFIKFVSFWSYSLFYLSLFLSLYFWSIILRTAYILLFLLKFIRKGEKTKNATDLVPSSLTTRRNLLISLTRLDLSIFNLLYFCKKMPFLNNRISSIIYCLLRCVIKVKSSIKKRSSLSKKHHMFKKGVQDLHKDEHLIYSEIPRHGVLVYDAKSSFFKSSFV